MALSRIKLMNKKQKREMKRRKHQFENKRKTHAQKISNKRMTKMYVEGRREELKRRQAQINYVKQLESDLTD